MSTDRHVAALLAMTRTCHCEQSEAIQTATAFGLAVTDGGHCERSEAKVKEKYEH